MPVDVVAIVSPVPGKEARVEEILKELISKVETDEPDVSRYIAYKSKNAEGATEYIFTERYKDEATLEAHSGTEHFLAASKKFGEEGLVSKALTIYKMEPLHGFDSR